MNAKIVLSDIGSGMAIVSAGVIKIFTIMFTLLVIAYTLVQLHEVTHKWFATEVSMVINFSGVILMGYMAGVISGSPGGFKETFQKMTGALIVYALLGGVLWIFDMVGEASSRLESQPVPNGLRSLCQITTIPFCIFAVFLIYEIWKTPKVKTT